MGNNQQPENFEESLRKLLSERTGFAAKIGLLDGYETMPSLSDDQKGLLKQLKYTVLADATNEELLAFAHNNPELYEAFCQDRKLAREAVLHQKSSARDQRDRKVLEYGTTEKFWEALRRS